MHAKKAARLQRFILTSAAILLTAVVAGCGDDDEEGASNEAAAAPVNFAVDATAEGKKKALKFPATVKAGPVTMTLTNSDSAPRSAAIVRVLDDHTVEDVMKVINSESDEGEPIPLWMEDGGGVPTVKPGASASATQVLAPGKYVIWDDEEPMGDGPDNSELGAKGEFTVTGPASDAEVPTQPAIVKATDDGKDEYGFEFTGLKAGTNTLTFENTGKELHHALFFPIAKGKTFKDAEAAFQSEEEPQGPPPVDFANGVGTQVIDGGVKQNITLDLKPGSYAVICFVNDRKGGKPHVADGMIKELTIK